MENVRDSTLLFTGVAVCIAVILLARRFFPNVRMLGWVAPQRVRNLLGSSESESSATWTILGLWALVMGALYFYWPDQFKQFWNWHDHMVFLGLPLLLVIIAQALDRPTKTLATKWIGGALLTALIVIYVIVVAEQFGVSWSGTEEVAGETLQIPPGGVEYVDVAPGETINWICTAKGSVFDARINGAPVPCGPEVYTENFTLSFDPETKFAKLGFRASEDKEMVVHLK